MTYWAGRLGDTRRFSREDDQRWDLQLRELTAKYIGACWARTSVRRKVRRNRSAIVRSLDIVDQAALNTPISWTEAQRQRLSLIVRELQILDSTAAEANIASDMAFAELSIIAPEAMRGAVNDVRDKSQLAANADFADYGTTDDDFVASREALEKVVRSLLRVK